MLQSARLSLQQLRFIDQASIAKGIGTLQGASLQQSALGLSVTGTPLPSINTTTTAPTTTTGSTFGLTGSASQMGNVSTSEGNTLTLAPGSPVTQTLTSQSNVGSSTSNQENTSQNVQINSSGPTQQTVTNRGAITPTAPSLPQTGATFTLPSSFSTSASDLLNDETQLTFEVANLSLLLEGSLNDRFVKGTKILKQRTTIGFPVSIATPSGKQYRNAVAEVEAIVRTISPLTGENAPGLIAVLPREKTFNVAKVTDKSFNLSGAVATQVVSLGANWLRGSKTYYIVKDQDTIAFQSKPADNEADTVTVFGWQFRPVLGESVLRNGLRQTFVQLAFPVDRRSACLGKVKVTTRWRRYDPKRGVVGSVIKGSEQVQSDVEVDNFDLTPDPPIISWTDSGNGLVTTTLAGGFLPGTHLRLGASILDSGSTNFLYSDSGIQFTVPATQLAAMTPFIVARDGNETELIDVSVGPKAPSLRPCGSTEQPIPDQGTAAARQTGAASQSKALSITGVKLESFDDANAEVDLSLQISGQNASSFHGEQLLALIGNRVFGLSDSPFMSKGDPSEKGGAMSIQLLAPLALLRAARSIKVKRPFWGKNWEDAKSFDLANITRTDIDVDFVPTKVVVASQTEDSAQLAIVGSDLSYVDVLVPDSQSVKHIGATLILVPISAKELKGLKQVLLRDKKGAIALVPLPESSSSKSSADQQGTAPPKTSLEKSEPIKSSKGTKVTIKGVSLDAIQSVLSKDKPLTFALASDKKSLTVSLPDDLTSTPGVKILTFILKDGTVIRHQIVIVPS
jgi:hypothetical protein